MKYYPGYMVLEHRMAQYGACLVAFSGGADSTLLARVAFDVLGGNAIAVTAVSETYTHEELEFTREITRAWGMEHIIIQTSELSDRNFSSNPQDRCYYCKKALCVQLAELAKQKNIPHILEGSNVDDLKDHRPGRRALEEYGVQSPLVEAGLTKKDVRRLSRELGLPTYDKPAQACLASRIPYGEVITAEKLRQIEQGEKFIRTIVNIDRPFQLRVRHYGQTARIETELEMIDRVQQCHADIAFRFKEIGFQNIVIDPQGYRMGNLNVTNSRGTTPCAQFPTKPTTMVVK